LERALRASYDAYTGAAELAPVVRELEDSE
jgi:hypothetical protein